MTDESLGEHIIDRVEIRSVDYRFVRPVGKNARLDTHGQDKKCAVAKLYTHQGAMGWGLVGLQMIQNKEDAFSDVVGKSVAELICPDTGILPGVRKAFDFALHDLAGIILNKPVYELLGARGNRETPIYSGMIYFDELEPVENPGGIEKILENCRWDVDYGYRGLKVKIGRGHRWYSHDEGLEKDIEIVKQIHEMFKKESIDILVDANDGYSFEYAVGFLEEMGDVPIYWFEEPFLEEPEQSGKLRDWMTANGFEQTYLADGETKPDYGLCKQLIENGTLDVCLHDVQSFGFTHWRQWIAELEKHQVHASPHAWGSQLKTHYIAHLAAGLGSCLTIEGVTCESDDIDFGDYKIIDGKIRVSEEPGFGMTLLN